LIRHTSPNNPQDFFWPRGKKLKNLGFLGEIFQTQTKDGSPNPGQKFLTRTSSYFGVMVRLA